MSYSESCNNYSIFSLSYYWGILSLPACFWISQRCLPFMSLPNISWHFLFMCSLILSWISALLQQSFHITRPLLHCDIGMFLDCHLFIFISSVVFSSLCALTNTLANISAFYPVCNFIFNKYSHPSTIVCLPLLMPIYPCIKKMRFQPGLLYTYNARFMFLIYYLFKFLPICH